MDIDIIKEAIDDIAKELSGNNPGTYFQVKFELESVLEEYGIEFDE